MRFTSTTRKVSDSFGGCCNAQEARCCAELYDTDSPTIWIDASVGDAYVQQVLIHEIGHAMLHLSGAMHELAEDMKPGTDIDRVEERLRLAYFVRTFGGLPHLSLTTLSRLVCLGNLLSGYLSL